jgi:predicted ATPase
VNIIRVQIKNFKSLKDIDIELSNLNLLTGVNSSGKSSFIQTLLLLKQNEDYFLTEHNKNFLNIKGDYVNIGNKKDILFQETYDEDIEISIQSHMNNSITLTFNNNDLKFIMDGITSDDFYAKYNLFDKSFQYITTERIAPKITYSLSDETIEQNQIGTQGEFTAHYLAIYRHQNILENLRHKDSKTSQLLENVSLWLSEISENIEVKAKVYEELQSVDLKYTYTYGKTTTQDFTPLNVGFGITYVLPIITAILKAKEGDLIIIENPETHLHPKAQSKIAKLCAIAASSGIQIILETHSDHILNGIRVATKENILKPKQSKIYYFRKDKDNLETKADLISIDKDGAIDRYPKGFFDQFDEDLDRLIIW